MCRRFLLVSLVFCLWPEFSAKKVVGVKKCLQKFDAVYFLIDGSFSVLPDEFAALRFCMKSLSNLFSNSSFIEFYQYSSGTAFYKLLEHGWTEKEFTDGVEDVLEKQQKGGTDTFTHMEEIVRHWQELKRDMIGNETAEALLVLITDGVANDVESKEEVVSQAHSHRMRIMPIGVGIGITEATFDGVMSVSGDGTHVANYGYLNAKVMRRIFAKLCRR